MTNFIVLMTFFILGSTAIPLQVLTTEEIASVNTSDILMSSQSHIAVTEVFFSFSCPLIAEIIIQTLK